MLGISGGFGHDAAVAVVRDGVATQLIEEERLTRVKGAPKALPMQALDALLAAEPGAASRIDAVAVSWDPRLAPSSPRLRIAADELISALDTRGIDRSRVRFVPHHASHAVAAAAYCDRGFNSVVVVVDGRGEAAATSVYRIDGVEATLLEASPISSSLGHFYAAATEVCGFGPGAQGKTMGLAAYGVPRWRFDQLFVEGQQVLLEADDWDLTTSGGSARRAWVHYLAALAEREACSTEREMPYGINACLADLAASAQVTLDRVLGDLVRNVAAAHPSVPVLLCGGVGLNCATNRHLRDIGVPVGLSPIPHDAGGALGAALIVAGRLGFCVSEIHSPYLGLGWSDDDLRSALVAANSRFEEPQDIAATTAEIIHDHQVVGWFQGRAEVGPRALGHRSILARADSVQVRDRINKDIKRREPWRPFGPSIPESRVAALIDVPVSPFMVERAMPLAIDALRGVTHVDGMTRPHLVAKKSDVSARFEELLSMTRSDGNGALLNTSFNVGREPIVCSPRQAVATYSRSGLDALVLGPYLLRRT